MASVTPMMQQYLDTKAEYKDCILFFRLGDFYEMFFDDARTASRELELTLTGKDCGLSERAPMCGVPYHAVDTYVEKLIERGYKVAICEQMEDPALAKGLVKRAVTRIITPGTVIEPAMLDEKANNFLLSICFVADRAGLAFADVSTGEFYVHEIQLRRFARRCKQKHLKFLAGLAFCNHFVAVNRLFAHPHLMEAQRNAFFHVDFHIQAKVPVGVRHAEFLIEIFFHCKCKFFEHSKLRMLDFARIQVKVVAERFVCRAPGCNARIGNHLRRSRHAQFVLFGGANQDGILAANLLESHGQQ